MDLAAVRARLRGSIVPLPTPFNPEGAFDAAALRDLIDWQIASGSHGISVTGTTGEPAALAPAEREAVIATAVAAVRGRVPVVPGTGSNNFDETLRLTRIARSLGADAAMVIVPYYNRPSQEGLYQYFRALAEQVEIPIIVYNIPGRTAVNLAPTTLARLARDCPNIIGVKEANKDFEQVSHVLHQCGREFLLFSGIELLCYPMLALGGAGHISATANLLPGPVADLYNHVAAGRWAEAMDLHYRLLPLNEVLFIETNPGPLKYALGLMGRIHPALRLPLVLPMPAHQARIRGALADFGLIADAGPDGAAPSDGVERR